MLDWRGKRILLVHGSPDSVNEFVWESETGDAKLDAWLAPERVHAICATHSGLPWVRATSRGLWCNVGVLGRPAHDQTPRVGYALLHFGADGTSLIASLVPLVYDVAPVAAAIRAEGLPDAFAQALERGVWTTCSNILPSAENATDRYAGRAAPGLSHGAHARDVPLLKQTDFPAIRRNALERCRSTSAIDATGRASTATSTRAPTARR